MGRFSHLATSPARGPADMLRWKVVDALAGRNRRDPGGFVTPRRDFDPGVLESRSASLTWIGHASFLVTLGGVRLLVDPILAPRLGPVRRLSAPGIPLEALPPIDAVLITHNHRDHLDPWTLERLCRAPGRPKPRFYAPLGNAEVLRACGADEIVELDWWQTSGKDGLELTLVPARHWSMRYPWDRDDALWGGWVVRGPEGAAYHSGDTAYFDGFAEIGQRAGPIDWAMLPIGGYEPRWFMEPQHMNPEEAARAARELGATNLVAMHWGTFRLTDEPVGEPPVRVRAAWGEQDGDPERLWIMDVGESRSLGR